AELVAPATGSAEGVELVLADYMGGEAIGVGACRTLGVGLEVDLAVRLFEGLADLVLSQPCPPLQNDLWCHLQRMPQLHPRRIVEPLQWPAVAAHDAPLVPQ